MSNPDTLSTLPEPYYPPELPVSHKREEIVRAIREHQVLVVTGETGSGKSTQIPKMCLEAGQGRRKMVGCTQPRRIAAVTLASRVAEETGPQGARLVGYKIRFQDRTARSTRIKFMTDGILLAEAQRDRQFRAYDTLIIDEAHERSLNIDFLLGILRRLLPRRPDLKVVVTSATIDPYSFSRAFGDAPVIEVSGRVYPVETRYRPPDPDEEDATYVDQAVDAVEELKKGRKRGDVLVFMPTESDIRETVQRLEEKRFFNTVVLPLFGRLAAADQQRIFRPCSQDKIVVATNVAETSITIPGIQYVVDTGLARISRYNPRSRTQSLPVAPVSQASADQRKGRCGRVRAGVCIRLYSEEDYLGRPLYTPPEIKRSNLAEVILRMLFLRLGSVQDFPFIDPPSPAAVKDGFDVLQELGAVDDNRRITPLGRTMARLPLDPRLSRMLLEARKESALRETMVLTAALSIQDPRERPMEKEAQADQAHAPFLDRRSDFVTLLNLWRAWMREREASRSQSRLRKFCKERFLSYRRMREWRNIHEEIREILGELNELEENEAPAHYDAIHRCIVSGYLSHIAVRKEKNIYQAAKGRQIMLFPGSGLFNRGGAWIVSAEQVQTSRLFARTAASIDPAWLEELGGSLCRYAYFEPHWEKNRGQVVATEQVKLYGLIVVDGRKVDYFRVRPEEAREIFIRAALVEGEVREKLGFLEHNRALVQSIRDLENKTRRRDLLVEEEAVYRFYDERLPSLANVRSLKRLVKKRGGDDFLRMTEDDLLRGEPDRERLDQFPDVLDARELRFPLHYAFDPGQEADGVTVTIPAHALPRVREGTFDWLVPGLLAEKVTELLRALPKTFRKRLVPVNQTAEVVVKKLSFGEGDFYQRLSAAVEAVAGVRVPPEQWSREQLQDHLRMRFQVVDAQGRLVGAGRSLEAFQSTPEAPGRDPVWEKARKTWEKEGITAWDFGDPPPSIELQRDELGVARCAFPGLVDEGESAALRLFEDPAEAARVTRDGLLKLYRLVFASPLNHLRRDWSFPKNLEPMTFFMGPLKEANEQLRDWLLREIFDLRESQAPDRARFEETVKRLQGRLAAQGLPYLESVFRVVEERHRTRMRLERFKEMAASNPGAVRRLEVVGREVDRLVPARFLRSYRSEAMKQLPRYLEALRVRGERAYTAPEKDRLKEEQLHPHLERLEAAEKKVAAGSPAENAGSFLEEFRWMVEEFKIALFAPEIKTLYPVSTRRLEKKWDRRPVGL